MCHGRFFNKVTGLRSETLGLQLYLKRYYGTGVFL